MVRALKYVYLIGFDLMSYDEAKAKRYSKFHSLTSSGSSPKLKEEQPAERAPQYSRCNRKVSKRCRKSLDS